MQDAGLTNDNYFLVGSEEGTLYSGCRHGSKTGILESYEGHHGPVTGLDPHPGSSLFSSAPDLSHLFLTSSFDWTVKLWSARDKKPVYSFECGSDYVYDVSWSPVHPAVFATVDGTGRLDMWNLNFDTEVPAASVYVDGGSAALNCVSLTQSGQHVIVGDMAGKLWVYDLGDRRTSEPILTCIHKAVEPKATCRKL
ncbi:unnamed protein product [Notodromas monacha]|uniref:Uncharacterized protein n=1 Tax=Notodromas monacha TaxID=399045 RepID=A0A7R9GH30_9CRUS|nr:unnamed protein product [Notodromas monacha]CAG0920489.1 unnamed protein product [Notodromas monacha]